MSECFYSNGLRFACGRCSHCCRLAPGYVFLTAADLRRLLEGTGLSEELFLQRYCRQVNINGFRRLSLREKANYDCILWGQGGCAVYQYRPFQCRSYPFWPANLFTAESWEELKGSCPGVGKGKLHSCAEIQSWLREGRDQSFLEGIPEA